MCYGYTTYRGVHVGHLLQHFQATSAGSCQNPRMVEPVHVRELFVAGPAHRVVFWLWNNEVSVIINGPNYLTKPRNEVIKNVTKQSISGASPRQCCRRWQWRSRRGSCTGWSSSTVLQSAWLRWQARPVGSHDTRAPARGCRRTWRSRPSSVAPVNNYHLLTLLTVIINLFK